MGRRFNFFDWMMRLCLGQVETERILVFDPTNIPKSGKLTFGLGRFWSGKDSKAKKGLEFGCLAIVNVAEQTAYHLDSFQTPSGMKGKLIEHYLSIIMHYITAVLELSRYLVVMDAL